MTPTTYSSDKKTYNTLRSSSVSFAILYKDNINVCAPPYLFSSSILMSPRNTNVPASYLVLMQDNKVLLLQRANTGYHDGDYSVIAGHVEQGETFTDTVMREAKEEAGILLHRDSVSVAHIQHRKSDTDGSERVHTYFVATSWT